MDYEKEYNRVCNEYIPRVQELEEENKKLKEYKSQRTRKIERENKKLKEYNGELIEKHKKDISILCEENKRLKEVYEVCNLDSINKAFRISNLEMENRKLENKILKLGTRIYQNIDEEKRKEYQEYCKRHKL